SRIAVPSLGWCPSSRSPPPWCAMRWLFATDLAAAGHRPQEIQRQARRQEAREVLVVLAGGDLHHVEPHDLPLGGDPAQEVTHLEVREATEFERVDAGRDGGVDAVGVEADVVGGRVGDPSQDLSDAHLVQLLGPHADAPERRRVVYLPLSRAADSAKADLD